MNLRDYLHFNRLSYTNFAKKIRYDRSYISSVAEGKILPGKKFALIVEEATKGEVPAESFFQKQIDDIEKIA